MDNKNLSMKMEPNISFKHSISKIQKILGSTEQKKFVGRHNEQYHTPSRCDNSPYPMKYAAHLLLSNIGPPM